MNRAGAVRSADLPDERHLLSGEEQLRGHVGERHVLLGGRDGEPSIVSRCDEDVAL